MTYFYGHLFAAEPEISAMFPAAMDGQRRRFYRALHRLVVTRDEGLGDYLAELARAHRKFGVRREHYAAFRTALLAAAARWTPPGSGAGDDWLAARLRHDSRPGREGPLGRQRSLRQRPGTP
jgi:hemoglobin-like flavoprotein